MNSCIVSAIGAVAASTLTGQALAVDYVQCREMLRTRNEMVDKAARAELAFKDQLTKDECNDEKFQVVSVPARKFGNYTLEAFYTTDYAAKRACEKEVMSKVERVQKPYVAWDGSKLFSPVAIKWAKAQGKVTNDMKAAGCPYR